MHNFKTNGKFQQILELDVLISTKNKLQWLQFCPSMAQTVYTDFIRAKN